MKILRNMVRGALITLLVVIFASFFIFRHYDRGVPLIPKSKALSLLNNCDRFTHVGMSTRQAIEIDHVRKAGKHDAEAPTIEIADVQWRWLSGMSELTDPDKTGTAVFVWQTRPGLGDWNFPESQWALMSFNQDGDWSPVHCNTPPSIQ